MEKAIAAIILGPDRAANLTATATARPPTLPCVLTLRLRMAT